MPNYAYFFLDYPKSLLKFCNHQLRGKPESDSLKDWMVTSVLLVGKDSANEDDHAPDESKSENW